MTEQVGIRFEDGTVNLPVTEPLKEEIEKGAERMGISNAAACRMWIQMGRQLADQYDPKNLHENKINEKDPLTALIESKVSEGKNNAASLEEIEESVINEIDEAIWDVLLESEEINRDGSVFYK